MLSEVSEASLTPLFLNEQLLEEAHDYSCVMALMPATVRATVAQLQDRLDPADVQKLQGKDVHTTVLYGLHDKDPKPVFDRLRKHAAGLPPITAELQKISLFKNSDADILKMGVESPGLHQLNAVAKREPYTNNYPDYAPHVTVAYLQPGTGDKYLGLKHSLEGKSFPIRHLVHSNPDEQYAWMPLTVPTVREMVEIQQHWKIDANQVLELVTAINVGTRPMGMGMLRPIYPSSVPKKKARNGTDSRNV